MDAVMSKHRQDDWSHATEAEVNPKRRLRILKLIDAEIVRAYDLHGSPRWGRHEALAIIREEFEEAWDAVKDDSSFEELKKELIQTAAMCVRYLETEPQFWPEGAE